MSEKLDAPVSALWACVVASSLAVASDAEDVSGSPVEIAPALPRPLVALPVAVGPVVVALAVSAPGGVDAISGVLKINGAATGCAGLTAAAAVMPVPVSEPALAAAPPSWSPLSLPSRDAPFAGTAGAGAGNWPRSGRFTAAAKALFVPAPVGCVSGLFGSPDAVVVAIWSLSVLAGAPLVASPLDVLPAVLAEADEADAAPRVDQFVAELLALLSRHNASSQDALRSRGILPRAISVVVASDCVAAGVALLPFVVVASLLLPLLLPLPEPLALTAVPLPALAAA
jgi:hypothetical protein